jgi:hypothetical protein
MDGRTEVRLATIQIAETLGDRRTRFQRGSEVEPERLRARSTPGFAAESGGDCRNERQAEPMSHPQT